MTDVLMEQNQIMSENLEFLPTKTSFIFFSGIRIVIYFIDILTDVIMIFKFYKSNKMMEFWSCIVIFCFLPIIGLAWHISKCLPEKKINDRNENQSFFSNMLVFFENYQYQSKPNQPENNTRIPTDNSLILMKILLLIVTFPLNFILMPLITMYNFLVEAIHYINQRSQKEYLYVAIYSSILCVGEVFCESLPQMIIQFYDLQKNLVAKSWTNKSNQPLSGGYQHTIDYTTMSNLSFLEYFQFFSIFVSLISAAFTYATFNLNRKAFIYFENKRTYSNFKFSYVYLIVLTFIYFLLLFSRVVFLLVLTIVQ